MHKGGICRKTVVLCFLNAGRRRAGSIFLTFPAEVFQITKHGRPIGKLIPPDTARDPQAIAQAVLRLKATSGMGGTMKPDELKAMIHEKHRH